VRLGEIQTAVLADGGAGNMTGLLHPDFDVADHDPLSDDFAAYRLFHQGVGDHFLVRHELGRDLLAQG
jgi:hypothetical protein